MRVCKKHFEVTMTYIDKAEDDGPMVPLEEAQELRTLITGLRKQGGHPDVVLSLAMFERMFETMASGLLRQRMFKESG